MSDPITEATETILRERFELVALRDENADLRGERDRAHARVRLLEKRLALVNTALNYRGEP